MFWVTNGDKALECRRRRGETDVEDLHTVRTTFLLESLRGKLVSIQKRHRYRREELCLDSGFPDSKKA
jgi:hypothetical protein